MPHKRQKMKSSKMVLNVDFVCLLVSNARVIFSFVKHKQVDIVPDFSYPQICFRIVCAASYGTYFLLDKTSLLLLVHILTVLSLNFLRLDYSPT